MSDKYVRVYNSPENGNFIGFSAGAAPAEPDGFEAFMEEKGYVVEKLQRQIDEHWEIIRNLGSVSTSYYGIEPPLRSEDKFALGEWCSQNVYTGSSSGLLLDNRVTPLPIEPYHFKVHEVIAVWQT